MESLAITEVFKSVETNRIVLNKYFTKSIKKEAHGYTCFFIDLETGKFVKHFFKV